MGLKPFYGPATELSLLGPSLLTGAFNKTRDHEMMTSVLISDFLMFPNMKTIFYKLIVIRCVQK